MSINKTGTPQKIEKVANSDQNFEDMRKKIAEENNLVRCSNCNKLLSKKGQDNTLDVQHKHLQIVIEAAGKVKIKCPTCEQVNVVTSENG